MVSAPGLFMAGTSLLDGSVKAYLSFSSLLNYCVNAIAVYNMLELA